MSHNDHYEKLASNFEQAWFFTPTYRDEMSDLIYRELNFQAQSHFLDLGCGTGNYTKMLADRFYQKFKTPLAAVGVDNSPGMISEFNKKSEYFKGTAQDLFGFFSETEHQYDRILLKEIIHHLDPLSLFFEKVKSVMKPKQSKALIVTRPQEVEFPFFADALLAFSKNQPSDEQICELAHSHDFYTQVKKDKIGISLRKDRLIEMVRARFMSTFDQFTDEQIEQGIREIKEKYAGHDQVCFYDNLLFISVTL